MKRIALLITAMTSGVLMMTGGTFADEMTRTTTEGSTHVTTTPADPIIAPPSVQERSYQRTEHQSSTVTSDPVPPPPSVQEHNSESYRTEERSSPTDPLDPQEKTTTHSRVEERSSRTVPSPEVQQRTTVEKRSSTVTSE
jgi:hypothetical protein